MYKTRLIVGTLSWLIVAPLSMSVPHVSYAQLISPGELFNAHEEIDRMDGCTNCHSLGTKSTVDALCLNCHSSLRDRIESGRGFHASISDDDSEGNCASCHKDHFGRGFDPIRFDTTAFEHADTGYLLVSSHARVSCRGCHKRTNIGESEVRQFKSEHGALDRTYMGLSTNCSGCHELDNRHGNQFLDTGCQTCHDEVTWSRAIQFDHNNTEYRLTGRHLEAQCDQCHTKVGDTDVERIVVYRGLGFASCTSCHNDVHNTMMGSSCASCHQTSGWNRLIGNRFESTFNHGTTGFQLVGSHATLECSSCHDPRRSEYPGLVISFAGRTTGKKYPAPLSEGCVSCHQDVHSGEFVPENDVIRCETCHSETVWVPSSFDVMRHNQETTFELTGAHLAVLCGSCHPSDNDREKSFKIASPTCLNCHSRVDPHGGQFASSDGSQAVCQECHTTSSWKSTDLVFNHNSTSFKLDGRHQSTPCAACHLLNPGSSVKYRALNSSCSGCHSVDNPHLDQFSGRLCIECHDQESFRLNSFDHTATRFPLDGAHTRLACSSCHWMEEGDTGKTFVRFRPLGITCEDCHSETYE